MVVVLVEIQVKEIILLEKLNVFIPTPLLYGWKDRIIDQFRSLPQFAKF